MMNNTMMDFTCCKITTMIWFYAIRACFVIVVSIKSVIQKVPQGEQVSATKIQKQQLCQQGEQNLIYLTNWLFIHLPNVMNQLNSTKMLIIKPPPPPFDDEQQQRQQCTCVPSFLIPSKPQPLILFPSHQCNNKNMSEKQQ